MSLIDPIRQLCWRESELLCRCFAHTFHLSEKEVMQFGMTTVIQDNPDMTDVFLLTTEEIRSLTVTQLKHELCLRRLVRTGLKSDLQARLISEMNRIRNWIETEK